MTSAALNEIVLTGFMFGFWLTNFSCLVGFVAKKLFYFVVSFMR